MIKIGDDFIRKDPIFDGTLKSALTLIKKVFPSLHRYSSKEISNTSIGGLWDNKMPTKNNRIWLPVPSITALQVMKLAYYFQTECENVVLSPDYDASPNGDQYWWRINIFKTNSTNWEWKP